MKFVISMLLIVCFLFSAGCSVSQKNLPVTTDKSFVESDEGDTAHIKNTDGLKSVLNEISFNDSSSIKLALKHGCCISEGDIKDTEEINRIVDLMNSIEIEELSQKQEAEIDKKVADFTESIWAIGGTVDYCYFSFCGKRNIAAGGFEVYLDADNITDRTCIYVSSGRRFAITNMEEIKDKLFEVIDHHIYQI